MGSARIGSIGAVASVDCGIGAAIDDPAATVDAIATRSFARRFLLWALRHRVWCAGSAGGRALAELAFYKLGVPSAWRDFEAIVELWGAASLKPIEVLRSSALGESDDERAFVDAIAALQLGSDRVAVASWRQRLPTIALEPVLGCSERLAAALFGIGLLIELVAADAAIA